ncbi:LOW QUALITY PROTEIN: hypothetical protein Cgig2_003565 [Carnegiea gigantea]|uniref:Uncharacterized protein n=1 Tax=Carnegiea gigantea TaxID=171969 RepID=A0A9Q1JWS0_9CARY|nr:LOW QUALITY PROTEIN: hypothetical protein Cgig2_003565 [Carnegiea gigantea]
MFISSTYSPHASDSKKKESDLFNANMSKDEGELGSKPKLKIVHSGKPLECFVLPMEVDSSLIKIPGTDVTIPTIPIQSIAPLPQEKTDDVNFKEDLAHGSLPFPCFPSIGRIPSIGKDLFDNRSRLDGSKGVCSSKDDEVKSIHKSNAPSLVPHPQRPLRAPQVGISVFNAYAIIKEVDKNAARVFGKPILDKVSRTPFDRLHSLKGDFGNL